MQTRNLGGLATSAVGLGCMGLSQGYGPVDEESAVAVIRAAPDAGITLIDTAMSYGEGANEELVGRALGDRRGEVQLATKFGIVRGPDGVRLDGRPEHVRGYCEASLARLGTDVIDLYYLHRVDPEVPIAETVGAMGELVGAGLVRHLGLSEVNPAQLRQAAAVAPVAAVEFEWSLMWREPEDDVVPAAREVGAGLVPYSPLGRGLLTATLAAGEFATGDFRSGDPRFSGAEGEQNRALAAELASVAAGHGISAGRLALAWLLAQGDDVVPIPGTRRPARVAENASAAEVSLSIEDLQRLAAVAPREAWAGDRRSFAAHGTARS